MSEENRKAFEAWAEYSSYGLSVVRLGDGYRTLCADVAWRAWQAATAHAQARTCQWRRTARCDYRPSCRGASWEPELLHECPYCGGKVKVVSE
jgi:hypothetical protein